MCFLTTILGYAVPIKSKNSFMSHQKGLLLPLWVETTIDLVVTVLVLLLIIVLS